MSMRSCHLVGAALCGLLVLSTGVAHAQEASDDLATATAIAATPFAALTDASSATTAADEPVPSCMFPGGFGGDSLWYRYTPSARTELRADTFGSSYDTVLVVWDGGPAGAEVGCNDDTLGLQSAVTFTAEPGHTYYVQVAFWRQHDPAFDPPALLSFQLAPPPPPFAVTVAIDPIGRAAGATGVVEVAATVSCNRPGFVQAMVYIQQQHGRVAAAGLLVSGPCGPQPDRVVARFVGANARFTPGQASVTVVGSAQENPISNATIAVAADLRVQGAGPKDLALPPPPAP